jgi:hypothetical protein
MAGIARLISLLRVLALLSWRDVRSIGSISGQNFLLFLGFVALQPESAEFFAVLLAIVLLFPIASDPMEKIPTERRMSWPIGDGEWSVVRAASVLLSPISWLAVVILVRAGWRVAALVFGVGVVFYALKVLAQWAGRHWNENWAYGLPAPPGAMGAIMLLQWREMLRTLDPYLALVLMVVTAIYRLSGKALDPAAPRIMSLLVVLALSTEAQVLFGIDGKGAERYRLLPIRGWQILLAKDMGFLVLVGLLVWPLDFLSGLFGGIAALTVGHHNSVFKPMPQMRWRFTSGALFFQGVLQTIALFAVGSVVRTEGPALMALCIVAWCSSVIFYGSQWERRARI